MFCRAICSNVAVTPKPRRAGDVYNPSPTGLKHGREDCMNAMESAFKIDLHHAAPQCKIRLEEGRGASLAGIVYQNMNGTEAGARRVKSAGQNLRLADIGLDILKMGIICLL